VEAEVIFLVGRVLAGLMYLFFGLNHFIRMPAMIDYARSRRVLLPEVSVPLTGLALIAGALSIGLGYFPRVGVIVVASFLALAALMVHRPQAGADDQTRQQEMANFMKNIALAGSTLMLLAMPSWPLSVG
jgi:uncharacterized membrane protein YphA (DoxX/SURF4 family)